MEKLSFVIENQLGVAKDNEELKTALMVNLMEKLLKWDFI